MSPSARTSVVACAGLLACLLPPESRAYDGPIIDAHLHISAATDIGAVKSKFASGNIRHAVIFPREFTAGDDVGVTEAQMARMMATYSDIAWVLIGLQQKRLHHGKPVAYWRNPGNDWAAWLKWAEGELAAGRRKGMGELIVRHYDYHGRGKGEVDFPIKSRVFQDLMGVSNRTRRPLVIHAEGEAHVVKDLLETLPSFPTAKLVWAHGCGRSDPKLVREWLAAHANLYCDLGNMTDTGNYGSLWPRAGKWTFQVERKGTFDPEWLAVIHAFPERLTIGSDVNESKGWRKAWDQRMSRFRKLLDQVKPEAREWLAYRTAENLFGR